jgi:hypothetical protein
VNSAVLTQSSRLASIRDQRAIESKRAPACSLARGGPARFHRRGPREALRGGASRFSREKRKRKGENERHRVIAADSSR